MNKNQTFSPGAFFHGTRANLEIGDDLKPGFASNYNPGKTSNFVYFTGTLEPAIWGAELAKGDGRQRIYVVEPQGDYEDDPNVTDKKFPGNPTQSYRTKAALRVKGEVIGWQGHAQEDLELMHANLKRINDMGIKPID